MEATVPQGVAIRPGVPGDARAIAEVHVRAWQASYRDQLPEEGLRRLSVDQRETTWRRALEHDRPDRPLWVAERRGQVVGFVAAGPALDEDEAGPEGAGQVYAIYLEPGVIGTGIGRALFAQAMEGLRALGYRVAILWVLESNARARRFYEIAGWRSDGTARTEELFGFRVHEVRYRVGL